MMIMHRSFADHMGFNWPKDLAMIVDEKRITFSQIKKERVERQRSHLQNMLASDEPVIQPCFICTFRNKGFPFGGWWLCVQTLKETWTLDFRGFREDLILKIMRMYPCGHLPFFENIDSWEEAFADAYHYPTQKRPTLNGMVIAWASVSSSGHLLDIFKERENNEY